MAMTGGALRGLFRRTGRRNPTSYAGTGGLETSVILPDMHVPWHDVRAARLVFDVVRWLKPDTLASVGDMFDMMAVSRHDKTLDQRAAFQKEIEADKAFLDELGTLPARRKVITLGNHDVRIDKYVNSNAPEMEGMITLETFLGLQSRGWEVHPYQTHFRIGKINFVHDIGNCGKNADKELGAAFEASAVQGHTHRAGITYFGNIHGETHVAATIGWLGSREAAKYMAAAKVSRNWQLGFGLLRVETATQLSHFQFIPIVTAGDTYSAVVDGRLFTG